MTITAGLLLGAGLVLIASVWLWPTPAEARSRRGPLDPLRDRLHQAGLAHLPTAVPIVVSVLLGVVAAALVLAVSPVPVLALAAAALGGAMPLVALSVPARRLQRAAREAWPDLVDHLVAGIRSGLPLAESIGVLAQVGPTPVREAFRHFERSALGSGTLATALDDVKATLADPVADRIVETLQLAREVGGSELPSVLRALAASLRQDAAVRAEVEARQSWVRGAARLGVIAPWAVLLLLSTRPETAAAYNSPGGLALLAVGLVVTGVAYRIMIALGRLPADERWFA